LFGHRICNKMTRGMKGEQSADLIVVVQIKMRVVLVAPM